MPTPGPIRRELLPSSSSRSKPLTIGGGVINEEILQYDPWVEALRKTALENALREEVAAQVISLVAWTKWIHEGPAAGLRRQHRFSRVADG